MSSESLHIEVEREVCEDLASEHAESLWPKREGYDWVAEGVRECCSKYRWSRLLRSWLNSVYLFERGADTNVVSIDVYACMFMKLHVRLPFDDFTMGVLRKLNVAPTQLHPNS